jgi:hypothetical protein
MHEPFFEDQIFSEIGFAFETIVLGGPLFNFVPNGRFEYIDKRESYPRLGHFQTSYPVPAGHRVSPNQALLDNAKLPDEARRRPISLNTMRQSTRMISGVSW